VARLLYILNDAPFFVSHRLPLAVAAMAAGYEVHLAAPPDALADVRLVAAGVRLHPLRLGRSESTLRSEWRAACDIASLLHQLRPELVHNVTIKPVLYGSLARRLLGGGPMVNAVPGLGYVFLATGAVARIRRAVVEGAYRAALGGKRSVAIFQNPEDASYFVTRRMIRQSQTVLIRGSGVDLAQFPCSSLPDGAPLIVLPARMLRDKGVLEFAAAAAALKPQFPTARFVLVGGRDVNRSGLTESELQGLVASGAVEWWGQRDDMADVLAASRIVVLPSYREGVPKALLEAAAVGRPIITTDVPGCREVVTDGVHGLLVPPRRAETLADAVRTLLLDPARAAAMGKAARARAVAEFSIERVVEATLRIYQSVMTPDISK